MRSKISDSSDGHVTLGIGEVERIWEEYQAVPSPSAKQAETFVENLLALPHEASSWSDVFAEALKSGQVDFFKIFHRLAGALASSRNRDFTYVCWSATEQLTRLNKPERLPEISKALLEFNPQPCDPDALSHIADALLAAGYVSERIELMAGFLQNLRENDDVVGWVVPRVAEELFLLRLGLLVASGENVKQTDNQLMTGLCEGLGDDICDASASVAVRCVMQTGVTLESLAREHFMLVSSETETAKQKILWNRLQQAFIEVAHDGWFTEKRHPAVTLIGLHMLLRSAEFWLESDYAKKMKKPRNLLSCLSPEIMDRLVPIECAGILGLNKERANVMLDACTSLTRSAGRRGLIADTERKKAEKGMVRMLAQIKIV